MAPYVKFILFNEQRKKKKKKQIISALQLLLMANVTIVTLKMHIIAELIRLMRSRVLI